jgi:LacI family transcriptional regulator
MSVTLQQIADELDVSRTTVANALNGKARVGESMRLKIQETARQMGYDKYANREAQILIARRHGHRVENGVIALIYQPVQDATWYSVPFYRSLVDGVEHEMDKRGMDLYTIRQRGKNLPRIVREGKV